MLAAALMSDGNNIKILPCVESDRSDCQPEAKLLLEAEI